MAYANRINLETLGAHELNLLASEVKYPTKEWMRVHNELWRRIRIQVEKQNTRTTA